MNKFDHDFLSFHALLNLLIDKPFERNFATFKVLKIIQVPVKKGKLPGLVVNIEDSQSEPWSLDVSSIPGFA
jgi:hypothetical protein